MGGNQSWIPYLISIQILRYHDIKLGEILISDSFLSSSKTTEVQFLIFLDQKPLGSKTLITPLNFGNPTRQSCKAYVTFSFASIN